MTTTFIPAHGEHMVQCPYNVSHQITNAKIIIHLDKCRADYLKNMSSQEKKRVMKVCRFDARHHVPDKEIRFHEDRCEGSFSVVRHMAFHNSAEGDRQYDERRRQDLERNDVKPPMPKTEGDRKYDRYGGGSSSSSRDRPRDTYRDRGNDRNRYSNGGRTNGYSDEPAEPPPSGTTNDWGLVEEDWEAECDSYQPGYDPEVKLKTEMVMYQPQGLKKAERKKFREEVREKANKLAQGEKTEWPTASTFDIKPDIGLLNIKSEPEDRKSPLEPGEISDEDDHAESSRSPPPRRYRSRDHPPKEKNPSLQHSSYQFQCGSTSSTSWQSQSNYDRPSSSSRYDDSRSHRRGREREVVEPYADDSDDYEGLDPYP